MASTTFPTRPFSNTLHNRGLPDRSANPGFGSSSQMPSREHARVERERQERERVQREQREAQSQGGAGNAMGNLTDEQREEIGEAFSLFDLDKDQRIDYHEFKVALKALGFDLPKPDLLSLLHTHGISPDAPPPGPSSRPPPQQNIPPSRLLLTLPAFQTIAADLISRRHPRDEILRAFALFDTEDKGMITIEDLRRVARELGEGMEEEELLAMVEEFDLEGKGGVGREEFVGICMG